MLDEAIIIICIRCNLYIANIIIVIIRMQYSIFIIICMQYSICLMIICRQYSIFIIIHMHAIFNIHYYPQAIFNMLEGAGVKVKGDPKEKAHYFFK